jgi:hypothetical protein
MSSLRGLLAGYRGHEYSRGPRPEGAWETTTLEDDARLGARAAPASRIAAPSAGCNAKAGRKARLTHDTLGDGLADPLRFGRTFNEKLVEP